jgi:hypothetical protein
MKRTCDVYFEVSIVLRSDPAVLDIWFVVSSSTIKMIQEFFLTVRPPHRHKSSSLTAEM